MTDAFGPLARLGSRGLIALALAAGLAAGVRAEEGEERRGGWYPVLGGQLAVPLDSDLKDVYSTGLGLSAGMGYALSSRWRAEFRLDWLRRESKLDVPVFAESAEGTLTLIPALVTARYALARRGARPYAAAGAGLLFVEEQIEYSLLGHKDDVDGRDRSFAAQGELGVEIPRGRFELRLGARYLYARDERHVLRATGRADDRDTDTDLSHLTFGLTGTYR